MKPQPSHDLEWDTDMGYRISKALNGNKIPNTRNFRRIFENYYNMRSMRKHHLFN
jgi:hypothetical protein